MDYTTSDIPLGAHLVTPRLGYLHHGIYVGNGQVVHYGGAHRLVAQRAPVRQVSLVEFANGRRVEVKKAASAFFAGHEIARRARSRLGEDRYHLINNNCEHFCEWCTAGIARSAQVERWGTWIQRAKRLVFRSFSALGQNAVQQHTWSN